MSFFISEAWAEGAPAAAAQPQGGGMMTLIMFGVLIAMMYFMIWRPQSKRVWRAASPYRILRVVCPECLKGR